MMTPTAQTASTAVSQKMPGTPIQAASMGENTREAANVRPIEAPTKAMARVSTTSRTESAIMAVTAAETAPAPCSARPAITISMLVASAASALPAANTRSPKAMTGLRPNRSLAAPKGICKMPCVSP